MELLGNYNRVELRKQLEAKAEEIKQAISKLLKCCDVYLEQFNDTCSTEYSYVGVFDDEDEQIYEHPDHVHVKFELSYISNDLQNYIKRLDYAFVIIDFSCTFSTKFSFDFILCSQDLIKIHEEYYKHHQVL